MKEGNCGNLRCYLRWVLGGLKIKIKLEERNNLEYRWKYNGICWFNKSFIWYQGDCLIKNVGCGIKCLSLIVFWKYIFKKILFLVYFMWFVLYIFTE